MALRLIGTGACPYCERATDLGIARGGEGNAVHLICHPCGVNIQAHRLGPVGQRLEHEATTAKPPIEGNPPEAEQADPFAKWRN